MITHETNQYQQRSADLQGTPSFGVVAGKRVVAFLLGHSCLVAVYCFGVAFCWSCTFLYPRDPDVHI